HPPPFPRHPPPLLIYHGWGEEEVVPGGRIEFYQAAAGQGAKPAEDWIRLFMAPGMAHCAGGEGPSEFDALGALEHWVEQGSAPAQILASHRTAGQVDRT